jgi:hypothetical protein
MESTEVSKVIEKPAESGASEDKKDHELLDAHALQ